MAIAVAMPKLGMAMEKGTVGEWLRAVGENVEAGEDLLEISTEKITATIPAPTSGVLLRIEVPEKAEVPVGTVLAYIGVPDEELPKPSAVPVTPVKATAAAAPAPARAAKATPTAEVQASPAARRMARDLDIDIALVSPSAPGRRVTTEDVERFAAEGVPAAVGGEVLPFQGIRAVVAERMTESLRTMAQVTITREVNATELVARREAPAPGFEAATGVRLSYTDLLVRETARLLPYHPILNSTLTEEGIVLQPEVHMGFAVALDNGLIVPVIREANRKSLGEITRERVELAARAREGTLGMEEIEGGTFTITNLGSFGSDAFTPIINLPQVAILGMGRIVARPMVVEGQVTACPSMWLSLTIDHRVVDGAPGARFLDALASSLESPEWE